MNSRPRHPHLGPWDVIDAAGAVVATFDTKDQALAWGNRNMPGEYASDAHGDPDGWSIQVPGAEIVHDR